MLQAEGLAVPVGASCDVLASSGPVPCEAVGFRDDLTLLYEVRRGGRPLVLLAGHLDTVPAQGNLPGRLEDGVGEVR